MDLFDYMRESRMKDEAPLASRLRPRTLDEIVGQKHILGKDRLFPLCSHIWQYICGKGSPRRFIPPD